MVGATGNKRRGLWVGLIGASLLISGCNEPAPEWAFEQSSDPISLAHTTVAIKRFKSDADPNLVTEVKVTCRPDGPKPDPWDLFIGVSTYDEVGQKAGQLPPAPLASEELDFRFDDLGSGSIGRSGRSDASFNNVWEANFTTLLVRTQPVAKAVYEDVSASSDEGLKGLIAARGIAATITTGNAQDAMAVAVADVVDDAEGAASMRDALARATSNFKWGHRNIIVRYRAITSTGTAEHTVTIPLQEPAIVKVAAACGWSQKPPASPEPQNNAPQAGLPLPEEAPRPNPPLQPLAVSHREGAGCRFWLASEDSATEPGIIAETDLASFWINRGFGDEALSFAGDGSSYLVRAENGTYEFTEQEPMNRECEECSVARYTLTHRPPKGPTAAIDVIGECGS